MTGRSGKIASGVGSAFYGYRVSKNEPRAAEAANRIDTRIRQLECTTPDFQHQNILSFELILKGKQKGKPSAAIEVKSKSLFGPVLP